MATKQIIMDFFYIRYHGFIGHVTGDITKKNEKLKGIFFLTRPFVYEIILFFSSFIFFTQLTVYDSSYIDKPITIVKECSI